MRWQKLTRLSTTAPSRCHLQRCGSRDVCWARELRSQGLRFQLKDIGVALVLPKIPLPLRRIEISVPPRTGPGETAGIPVVLEYETKDAPLYPPEGLFVDACVLYERGPGGAKVEVRTESGDIVLNGKSHQLASNPIAAGGRLKEHAKRLAKSGFISMIRPARMPRKPQIYLLDPYDPDKTALLMVHGLQSTPVAFATIVNALRSDPEIRANYQTWQFYYASGTPVLANALALRESPTRLSGRLILRTATRPVSAPSCLDTAWEE